MAIIIPSKYIFGKQTQKVRDNVIERIEIEAVEVVPDNDYETPVYNQSFADGFQYENFISAENKDDDTYGYGWALYSFYKLMPIYLLNIEVKIPKINQNKFIQKIFYSAKNQDGKIVPDIKKTIYAKKYIGTISTTVNNYVSGNNFNIVYGNPIYGNPNAYNTEELTPSLEYKFVRSAGDYYSVSKISFQNKETIASPSLVENDDYYILSFNVFSGYEEIKGGGYNEYTNGSLVWTEQKSECVKIIPEAVEITIYGNTIGIDLVDKTVYINGETQKKVHSIDGNELMQTSNYLTKAFQVEKLEKDVDYSITYYDANDTPTVEGEEIFWANVHIFGDVIGKDFVFYVYDADSIRDFYVERIYRDIKTPYFEIDYGGYHIKRIEVYSTNLNGISALYENTINSYKNGKETATICCLIGDYYDAADKTKKAISVDSADKMCFDVGDKVVPMGYSLGGVDKPLSVNKQGNAKVFEVLGRKILHDGEPLQQLSIQECGSVVLEEEPEIPDEPIVVQLTAPTISLDGDTLTIASTDDRTETFAIFVDGTEMATVTNEEIAFTIDGVTHYAEYGMKWQEWANSDYNTIGLTADGGAYVINKQQTAVLKKISPDELFVSKYDKITNNGVYVWSS